MVKVAIIDSGVHAGNPHVSAGAVAGAVTVAGDGTVSEGGVDLLGHGTAVAGAILEKCPDARIYAVRIFERRLSATIEAMIGALDWCRAQKIDVINLSLGTSNEAHRERLEQAIARSGVVVSAKAMLPGKLDGVLGVESDAACPRDQFYWRGGTVYASPYPRPIPGVPVERNLQGVSFAVANVTGLVSARLAQLQEAEQGGQNRAATDEQRVMEIALARIHARS